MEQGILVALTLGNALILKYNQSHDLVQVLVLFCCGRASQVLKYCYLLRHYLAVDVSFALHSQATLFTRGAQLDIIDSHRISVDILEQIVLEQI